MNGPVLCVGEVLWDALPAGLYLGGAPVNVACHLRELGRKVAFLSRVGDDELGREIGRRLARRELDLDLLQIDPVLPTGFVRVDLDEKGSPSFEILAPAAWDALAAEAALEEAASEAAAIVFGSLAQRDERSRGTLETLLEPRAGCLRVFDVNLRPPYDRREVVEASLKRSDLVKLNDDEMRRLAAWFGWPAASLEAAAAALAEACEGATVCVTRGAGGALLRHAGRTWEHPGFRVQVADAVGAGDAFLAALLHGLLEDADPEAALREANALGAYVATQHGATPRHDRQAIDALKQSS
ncbi:MAG: carbohydrate kinase [Planctomycetota bacterium]|nr:carbohydrate kinase [Planctomycetota bacterium]